MARTGANGRFGVDVGQCPALLVNGKGRNRAAGPVADPAGLADGVEEAAVGRDVEEGRIVNAANAALMRERPSGHVEAIDVNAVLVAAGIGADIDEIIAHGSTPLSCEGDGRKKEKHR